MARVQSMRGRFGPGSTRVTLVVLVAMTFALFMASTQPSQARSKCDEDFAMYMDHVSIYENALLQKNRMSYETALSGIGYLIGTVRSSKTRVWLSRVDLEMRAFRVGTYPFVAAQNRLLRGYC